MHDEPTHGAAAGFIPINALTIIPGTTGRFDLYLLRGDKHILYASQGDIYSEERLAKVLEVTDFYIRADQKLAYEAYIAKHLGAMLENTEVPVRERARIFHAISASVMKRALDDKLPKPIGQHTHKELLQIVDASLRFFSQADALKSFSSLISHTYHTYSHSVQTMVLAVALMQRHGMADAQYLKELAMGALLHDIGKTETPEAVLAKNPYELTAEERRILETHPVKGMRVCASLGLSQTVNNCILFHHETMDGMGYPGGLPGKDIPLEARAVSLCNVYDLLTSDTHWAKALPPYEALKYMQQRMAHAFDPKLYKRLVFVLSESSIV